jgi:hypothetical protein
MLRTTGTKGGCEGWWVVTEVEKFQQWYEAEKAKGLVDIKFVFMEHLNGASTEEVFREINECIAAKEAEKNPCFR